MSSSLIWATKKVVFKVYYYTKNAKIIIND